MNLKAERVNRGLSRGEAAVKIGVPTHVLRYAERGGRPQLSKAKQIADFYGVAVTDIWPVEPPALAGARDDDVPPRRAA